MDNVIFTSNLEDVKTEIVIHLMASGIRTCSYCSKPFNAARKPKGVSRFTHTSNQNLVNTWSFLLCRKCTIAAKQKNTIYNSLLDKAIKEEALFMRVTKGKA